MPQMSPIRKMLYSNLFLKLLYTENVQECGTQHFNLEILRSVLHKLSVGQMLRCAMTYQLPPTDQ